MNDIDRVEAALSLPRVNETELLVAPHCSRCQVPLRPRAGFMMAGELRCLRCTLMRPSLLRRSLLTGLVVGTILTAINQGNLLLHGAFPAVLYWKIPLTYSVPFCVATFGALVNSRPLIRSVLTD